MTSVLEDCDTISINKWGSLNTAASPMKLPEGQSPDNKNVWMDEKPGSLVTSNGYIKLGQNPSGNPNTFIIDFFKTSDGSQTVVLSDGTTVWKTTDYVNYTQLKTGLSAFFQLRGAVIRGKLWMTNGSDPVMTYDGVSLAILDGTGGTPNVPLGKYIAYHDERVWLYGINGDPSSLRFSDLANSSGTEITPDDANAWPADNEIQVSEGDDDIGTGLFLYRGFLYASKSYSIWRIVGYDEYTYSRVKTRSSTGTRFQESVRELDNLIHLIGIDGLYTFNGEESQRVSDIIDPSSSDPGVFAFRNLQQPLLNNQFWNVSDTADFAAGTVPNVLDTSSDKLTLVPADDSQADFNSGTLTNVTADDNPGNLQLSLVTSGSPGSLISSGKNGFLDSTFAVPIIGAESYITDGNLSNKIGFQQVSQQNLVWTVDLGSVLPVGRVILRSFLAERFTDPRHPAVTITPSFSVCKIQVNTGSYQAKGASNGTWVDVGTITPAANPGAFAAYDVTVSFATVSGIQARFFITANGQITITEMEVYRAGFNSTGNFVSATIDYSSIPASFGALAASVTANGETYQFGTQSSADGSSWDSIVNVSNGGAIGSTLRRYLRWTVTLNSSTGVSSPVIDKVFVGGTYLSQVHDTGGNIFQWGAFQMDQNKQGQTINAYYRAGSSSANCQAAAWTAIVPGAVPGAATTDTFIQIRVEFSTTDSAFPPYINSFTANWIVGTGFGVNTLQNVASFVWLNRYWLAAATLGASANDIVLVKGKATFGSPWHKKDFAILSFCRFQDYFIAGSSTDGSIYRMEYGYSKNGSAIDSYFETADFTKPGAFLFQLYEIIFNGDRKGPYSVSVGVSIDGGITWTEKTVDLTIATPTTNIGFTKKLNISFMADKFRLRIRNNAADQPFSIDSLDIFYRLLPERGSLN